MKNLKVFEDFYGYKDRKHYFINKCWFNAKIGDILPEEDIYQH